jgi:hypothetical protein
MNFVVDDVQMLYILCYICTRIYIFICVLGLIEKQRKSGIFSASLPCICTRQRQKHTAKAFFAVHIHTAKGAVLLGYFVVRGRGEEHGKAEALPCGLEVKRTAKDAARQTAKPHGKECRSAKSAQRTAKALPCDFRLTHGKEVAGQIFAEQSLPCTHARQRLCRADFGLCCAFRLHGKA